MFLRSLFLLVLISLSHIGLAQSPLVRQYSPKEYKANSVNWSGVQAPNGRLFFANSDGLLTFDGRRWRLISVPGRAVRGVALYNDKIFFGTRNSIGVLDSDDPNFSPLWIHDPILKQGIEVKTIFNVQIQDSSVFFETQDYLFEFDMSTYEFIEAHKSPEYITATYNVDDKLYVVGEDAIFELKNGEYVPVRSTLIDEKFILTLIKHPKNGILAVAEPNLIYHFKNGLSEKPILLSDLSTSKISEVEFYLGAISNQSVAPNKTFFVTNSHGLLEIDFDGSLNQIYNEESGLVSDVTYNSFFDNEGNIWTLGQGGISHIQYSQKLKIVADNQLKNTPIHTTKKLGDRYYIAANSGLFVSETNSINSSYSPILKTQVWQLGINDNNHLIVAGGNLGMYVVSGNRILQNIRMPVATRSFLIPSENPNILYLGLYNGVRISQKSGITYSKPKIVEGISGDVRTIIEDKSGNIWFGTSASGLYRFSVNGKDTSVAHFDVNKGLCTLEHNMVYKFEDEVYATCRTGLHKFDDKTNRFRTISWGVQNSASYPRFTKLTDSRLVSLSDKAILHPDFSVADSLSLQSIDGVLQDVNLVEDNLLISSESGLYEMNINDSDSSKALPAPLMELWYNWKGEQKYFNLLNQSFEIPLALNEFTIRFSLPSYVQQQNFLYRYKLQGLHDSWRPYGNYTELTYADLSPGTYTMFVQVVNGQGTETPVYSGSVVVLPKWYQTWWAYTLLGIAILGAIYIFVWTNNYRLIRRNEYLVGLVDSRTEEIRQQNVQLSHQAEEIHRINEMRGRLTRIAVHDLRNPLHILQGYLDLLSEPDAETEKLRGRMEEVTFRMLEKINELLDVDQNGFRRSQINNQLVNVTNIVIEVIQNNNILARKKNQHIDSEILADIEMMGNSGKLNEIFDNVVNNAIKYSPTNSTITVHLSKITDGVIPRLLFKVADEGLGISESYMDKIFQPYTTGEYKPTGGEYSTGLGLSIVKQYVEELNGNISCMNREGRSGSIFIVTIPLSA